MDVTPFLEPKIAPRAVFDRLPTMRARPRFFVPTPDGDWRAVTWNAFAKQIRSIACFLADLGLANGDRGCIFAPNRVEWMSAALGLQAAGSVMVPIYPASTPEQTAYVVEHSDAKVLFVDTPALLGRVALAWSALAKVTTIVLFDDGIDVARVLSGLRQAGKTVPSDADVEARIVRWSAAITRGEAADARDPSAFEKRMDGVSLDQPGLMLYTSGTTGNPKGVPLTHRNVTSNGADWLTCLGSMLDEGMVDLLWLPMSHIFGFGEACLGNALGFTTYLCEPIAVLNKLPEVRPSVFMSVPSVWEKLASAMQGHNDLEAKKKALATVTGGEFRFCLSGGAGLKREVKEAFHSVGTLIIEGYGLTESSPTLTMNRPDAFRFDTVGKPFPSVEIKLAEDGEILARGPNVFGGYHKDEAATREVLTADGWLLTGDVGRFTEDGFLQIIDRKKDILVTAGGKNVPPVNIEMRFADDPFFSHVVIYGDAKKYLVAGVWLNAAIADAELASRKVPAEERDATLRRLVQERVDKVNAELPSYETIKKFAILEPALTVEGGLLTAVLKLRRKKVYESFRDRFEAMYEDRA